MSMPVYSIECNKCDYGVTNMLLWGHSVYADEQGEFPCNKTYGWCNECQAIRAIEDFSDVSYQIEQIQMRTDWLSEHNSSIWHRIFSAMGPWKARRTQAYLDEIDKQMKTIALAHKRIGSEVCLACSSKVIQDLKLIDGVLQTRSNKSPMNASINFIHPNCGGEFIVHDKEMRFSIRHKKKTYRPDGDFLKEEYYE